MKSFIAKLLMLAGALAALTCGMCSLLFAGLLVVTPAMRADWPLFAAFIALGLVVSAAGLWVFRRGDSMRAPD